MNEVFSRQYIVLEDTEIRSKMRGYSEKEVDENAPGQDPNVYIDSLTPSSPSGYNPNKPTLRMLRNEHCVMLEAWFVGAGHQCIRGL